MLAFYRNERIEFKDVFDKTLSYEELEIVFKKLCRHYKISPYLTYGRGSNATIYRVQISNRWGFNFGVLCHEISHVVCYKKGIKGHNKKMWRVMKSVIKYCRRRNFWKEELDKRTEIKIIPIPSKSQILEEKIGRTEKNIERCEKRLQYFTKLYTTKIKKYRRRLSHLKRHQEKLSLSHTSSS